MRRGGTGPDPLIPPGKLGAKISAAQESALLKGLAVSPEDRYQCVAELYVALYGATIDGFPPEYKTMPVLIPKDEPAAVMESAPSAEPEAPAAEENVPECGSGEPETPSQEEPPARRKPKMLYIAIAVAAVCCLALGLALRLSGPSKATDIPEQQNEEEPKDAALAPEVHGVTWSFDDGVLTFSGTGKMPECENFAIGKRLK